jgi:outer membrane protein OmpA-like peptidoglycan-associated protein
MSQSSEKPEYESPAEATQVDPPRFRNDSDDTGALNVPAMVGAGVALLATIGLSLTVLGSVAAAKKRLTTPAAEQKPAVAVAQQAEVAYCTPAFKQVLERVLHSCGLAEEGARRGCKPADVKTFASISDSDFNALFTPLKDRGGVLLFDNGKDELDDSAKKLLEERFLDRQGARYFFVVARASKTGSADRNQALSHRRANSVLFHLKTIDDDPDLEKKVGLLWLGDEFGQLSKDYCQWPNSRQGEACNDESINRSTFVSWVDCRL